MQNHLEPLNAVLPTSHARAPEIWELGLSPPRRLVTKTREHPGAHVTIGLYYAIYGDRFLSSLSTQATGSIRSFGILFWTLERNPFLPQAFQYLAPYIRAALVEYFMYRE